MIKTQEIVATMRFMREQQSVNLDMERGLKRKYLKSNQAFNEI